MMVTGKMRAPVGGIYLLSLNTGISQISLKVIIK